MATRVGLGLGDFPFSDAASFWRWVDLCEAGGINSVWQSDRLSAPTPFLECMSVMAALARATKRLKFGMNVLSLAFREPLIVAKECATIDFLSNGRMLPAFGLGAMTSPDWAALGLEPKGQGARLDEALEIIARLWRGETVDSPGPHFAYRGARVLPLPVQQPMPLWLGGSSAAAIRRAARYGSGWQAGVEGPADVASVVAAIKAEAQALGQPMDPEHFGAGFSFRFGAPGDPVVEARKGAYRKAFPNKNPDDIMVSGDRAAIIAKIRDFEAAGITKFILRPLGADDADFAVQTRKLIETVLPEIHAKAPALS